MTSKTERHEPAPKPLPFERRQVDRWPADGAATAFELGGDDFGSMHTLRVLDFSDNGMGAFSDTVLAPGSTISIGFQRPGCIARRGDVVRCEPCGEGYRIAIRFQARMAA